VVLVESTTTILTRNEANAHKLWVGRRSAIFGVDLFAFEDILLFSDMPIAMVMWFL
jgi:hypothetical protein